VALFEIREAGRTETGGSTKRINQLPLQYPFSSDT